MAGFTIIESALPPHLLSVYAWLPAGADTRGFLEVISCSNGDVEKRKRGNRLIVFLRDTGTRFLEPIDNLIDVNKCW